MNGLLWRVSGLALLASGIVVAQGAQKTFATPEEAVSALIAAVKSTNTDDMTAVLGEDMKDQLRPGDPVLSDHDRAEFLQAAQTTTKIEDDTFPAA